MSRSNKWQWSRVPEDPDYKPSHGFSKCELRYGQGLGDGNSRGYLSRQRKRS
ncbi:hypothetical protein [Planctomicrobium piriforme]|uniref:hypothetical protein n=1 Tax=Planctomicrobium piriforme TaxID=1576369 RepID=UPI0015875439|nr:hypothetical protein [Planctomicrobium piriforme]